MTLKEVQKNILITACSLEEDKMIPCAFVKYQREDGQVIAGRSIIKGLRPSKNVDQSFESTEVKTIVRASAAAYPFLSAPEIKGNMYVDGGFLFNNVDILIYHFLQNQGVPKDKIKILSLGNAPVDVGISSMSILSSTTMLMGIAHSIKKSIDPSSYYQEYFVLAANNFQNSIQECQSILEQNYIRIEPEYNGSFIELDNTSSESINKLKGIGANWIQKLDEQGLMDEIIDNFIASADKEENSIGVIPRYYSYKNLFKKIEESYDSDEWKRNLLDFQFPNYEQEIIYPKNAVESFKEIFYRRQDDVCLLCKAASVGHIPSIKKILSQYDQAGRENLIKQVLVNNWNSLHYAAANGEISSFIYLISLILETQAFFPDENMHQVVPQRVKKALDDLKWKALREHLNQFLNDSDNQHLPFSNKFGPFFNFSKINTINLAKENNQLAFNKVMEYLLED